MKRFNVLLIISAIGSASCRASEECVYDPNSCAPHARVFLGGAAEIRTEFIDGYRAVGWGAYEAAVRSRVRFIENFDVYNIEVEDDPVQAITSGDVVPIILKIGNHQVRMQYHNHYLPACIQRAVPHVNFAVERRSPYETYGNLHIASWNETEGSRCVAVYITGRGEGWCRKVCWPGPGQIRDTLAEALIVAGIAAGTAYLIANIAFPVAAGALAL